MESNLLVQALPDMQWFMVNVDGAMKRYTNANACDSDYALEAFGRHYNYAAVIDSRNVCPSGWQVAKHDHWILVSELANNLFGGYSGLKSAVHWSVNGTNASGLGLVPAGEGYKRNGGFQFAGSEGLYWAPDVQYNSVYARTNNLLLYRNDDESVARSVRCVKISSGCTDETACNFDSSSSVDDGSCTYPDDNFLDCDGICFNDADGDGICDELEVGGCVDALACNYSTEATDDDGSCDYAEEHYNCNGECLIDSDKGWCMR